MATVADRRDAILRAVAYTGERLLQPGDLGDHVDRSLARLGEATGVDRVYVFRVDEAPGGVWLASQRHEWVAPGVEPQLENPDLQGLPFTEVGFRRWADVLEAGGTIHGAVADFPESEHEILAAQDIRALAVVPINADGAWWGFMGFDLTTDARPFHEAEIAALRTAAGILGAAIGQRRAWEKLEAQRRRLADALVAERDAVARLEELDRMKSAFLDAVSHELRTPLTAVLGLATTLRDAPLDEELRSTLVARLGENATRLGDVLGKLLDVNRLRADAERVQPEPVAVQELVTNVLAEHPVGTEREVDVDVVAHAVVDPRVLTRVLVQLLDNARVHTDAEHRVWITAQPDAEGLHVVVADDGDGIPAAVRERIFEFFDHGETRRPHAPGTGLGLSLVAGLARLHSGRAWCDDRPGGGAEFHVVLGSPA